VATAETSRPVSRPQADSMPVSYARDRAIGAVATEVLSLDPTGSRIAGVLRQTFDQLYDGQRSGRYRWDQLSKVEAEGCGPLVEINLQREFKFSDGQILDCSIGGVEVDCKYSQAVDDWLIPLEAVNRLCLVISGADNATPTFSAGLVRITSDRLGAPNRDAKAKVNAVGRAAVAWLFRDVPISANVLLQLDRPVVDNILGLPSGQKRVNQLFRSAAGRIVGRGALGTVAQQGDYMKRIRANGGASTHLQPEGIIILGQITSHVRLALDLGVPVPGRGDSVSVRLAPAKKRGPGVAEIGGKLWRIARTHDVIVAAPDLPSI
jgi:hypothetical protein